MARTPDFDPRINPFKNYLINGDMRISQRATSFAAIANGAYSLDRFINIKNTGASHTVTQDTDVPTFAQSGQFFSNSLRYNLTTPDDSILSGDVHYIEQRVEGFNFGKIANKPLTLSFWVKATLVGTYAIAFRNTAPDRSYVAEYTINASNTWEFKTVNVAGSPSAGTWNYTNGIGLRVAWILASGSDNNTTPGSWVVGNKTGTANIVNGVQTGATDFRITGAMLNAGLEASPFKLFSESIDGEIATAQRYYEKSANINDAPNSASGILTFFPNTNYAASSAVHNWYTFKVTKRAGPTMTFYDGVGNGGVGLAGKYSSIATGGTATNNLTIGDFSARENWVWFQAGAIGGHAGFNIGYAADAEL